MKPFAAILALMIFATGSGPARADCNILPSGTRPEGAVVYNSDQNLLQYCAGTEWKAAAWNMGGGVGCFQSLFARETDRLWSDVATSSDGANVITSIQNTAGAYTSPNGGILWVQRFVGPDDFTAAASSADGTRLALAAGRPQTSATGNIWTSSNSGASWTNRAAAGTRIWTDVASSADGMSLAAVAYGNSAWTSSDSGVTWQERTAAGTRNWMSISSSADGAKLVAVPDAGSVWTSTDSGASWTEQTSAGSQNWTSISSSADGTTLVAITNDLSADPGIYVSTDSGASWTVSVPDVAGAATAVSADGSTMAAAVDGGIMTSRNGGATWTTATSPTEISGIALSDDGTKLIASSGDDAGASWTGKMYVSTCISNPTGEPTAATIVRSVDAASTAVTITCTAPACPAGMVDFGCGTGDLLNSTTNATGVNGAANKEAVDDIIDGPSETCTISGTATQGAMGRFGAVACLRLCAQ